MQLIEAVNLILPKLGEHRVTRTDLKHPTLAIIIPEIENELKTLLLKGWWFNEFEYTAYPDAEKQIAVGADVLSFEPKCGVFAVLRNLKLYNPADLSYDWDAPVDARVRVHVDFEEIPESAAQYVLYSAAVNAFVTDLGLANEVQVWQAKAAAAYSDLLAEHIRQRKYSTRNSRRFGRLRRAMRGS